MATEENGYEQPVVDVEPQEIALIPRGIRFSVSLPDGAARGYVCENFGAMFKLPDLGEGLTVGRDSSDPVSQEYGPPFSFTGVVPR